MTSVTFDRLYIGQSTRWPGDAACPSRPPRMYRRVTGIQLAGSRADSVTTVTRIGVCLSQGNSCFSRPVATNPQVARSQLSWVWHRCPGRASQGQDVRVMSVVDGVRHSSSLWRVIVFSSRNCCSSIVFFFFPSVLTLLNKGEIQPPRNPKNDEQRQGRRGVSVHTMHRFALVAGPAPGCLSDMLRSTRSNAKGSPRRAAELDPIGLNIRSTRRLSPVSIHLQAAQNRRTPVAPCSRT